MDNFWDTFQDTWAAPEVRRLQVHSQPGRSGGAEGWDGPRRGA